MKFQKLLIPMLLSLTGFAYANNNIGYSLNDLKSDVIKEYACEYECSVYTGLAVTELNQKDKLIKFEIPVNSSKLSVLTLPFEYNSFNWKSFYLDGKEIKSVAKKENEILVAVPKGQYKLEIVAGIKNEQVFLTKNPKFFENKTNFNVNLKEENNSFLLSIEEGKAAEKTKENVVQESVNVYGESLYAIQREIFIEDKWKVRTTIFPMLASKRVTNLNVNLLHDEKIISQNVKVNEKRTVELTLDGTQVSWESVIEPQPNLKFMNENPTVSEIWKIYNKNNWIYSYTGSNPIEVSSSGGFNSVKTWMMWPGENVELKFSLPDVKEGQTSNVTDLEFQTDFKSKELAHNLQFNINTTIGGRYQIIFEDKAAELINLNINGREINTKIKDGVLILDLFVGENKVKLGFKSGERTPMYSFPKVKFESDVKNVYFKVINAETWNFFTYGGDIKPAILVVGILLLAGLIAFALGKYAQTPISKISWFLLLLGISHLSIVGMLIVIAWIIAFNYKEKIHDLLKSKNLLTDQNFNNLQVAYGLLTVVSIVMIVWVVGSGLLSNPNNYVLSTLPAYMGGSNLTWYSLVWDGVNNIPYLISFDLGMYRLITLGWAIWLAFSLMNWLSWMWKKYSEDGYWKDIKKEKTEISEVEKDHHVFGHEKD